jgi:hypothetical protein
VVAYASWWELDKLLGRALWAQVVSLGVAYVAGTAVYLLAAWALRMPEPREIVRLTRRRRDPHETESVLESEPRD